MSTPNTKTVKLEDSKLYELATRIALQVRETAKIVPHEDYYVLSSPAVQNATLLSSDIAMAVGKDMEVPKSLMADLDALHKMIEAELAKLEAGKESVKEGKGK